MSNTVLKNAYTKIGADDLSAYCQKVTLTYKADMLDSTAMSDNSHVKTGGLFDWSISADFFDDNTSSGPMAKLFSEVGTTVAIEIRPDAGAVGASNPKYTGNAVIESVTPVAGSVGQMQMVTVSLQSAGDLSRATA